MAFDITIEALPGEHITQVAHRMEAAWKDAVMAHAMEACTVSSSFNGVPLVYDGTTSVLDIVTVYTHVMQQQADAYRASPAYAEEQRVIVQKRDRQALRLKEALAQCPPQMTLRDIPAWEETVARNTDSYGSGIIRFADRWARLMEGRLAQGDSLEACAQETSDLADTEGITGFMYGAAVSVLAQTWVYGEALRRWHNLATQLGREGEQANEHGGVLNPALLHLGAAAEED